MSSESLESVVITPEYMDSYYKRISLDDGKFSTARAREDPVYFAKFMLGFTVRPYQAYLMDQIINNQKIVVIKGRQIGFSTSISLFCFWYAYFSKAKTGAKSNTEITVISKDDDAAKALLQQIKDFIYVGDKHFASLLKGRKEHTQIAFSGEITQSNVDLLKFKNGSVIRSFPPTGKVRGTSNDLLFIDEFAFLNNPNVHNFFYTDAYPTISETGGKIVVSSTPNGYGTLFYDLVDPDNKKEKHDFARFSFPYTINKDSPTYQANVEIMRQHIDDGKFKQEYLCSFEAGEVNFFNAQKVKESFDNEINSMNPDDFEYVCGIDYGMTESRTVVTLSTEFNGKIYGMYIKEFPSGWDTNGVIPFVQGLMDRYKINKIIADECVQGDTINKKMIELGWNVQLFDFHTEKDKAYCAYRNRMNKKEIVLAPNEEVQKQFLEMIQEESKYGKLLIHKPRSGRDDIVASLVMSAYPFLETQSKLGVYLI